MIHMSQDVTSVGDHEGHAGTCWDTLPLATCNILQLVSIIAYIGFPELNTSCHQLRLATFQA